MKTTRKQMAFFTLVLGCLAVAGCREPAVAPNPAPHPAPQEPVKPVTLMDVPPEQEDAFLFQQREAQKSVPADLKARLQKGAPAKNVRKFPYPYHAMLAISSDIDDTTPEEFAEYHRFLNTVEDTPHGPGLGLDIGDSMWMYMGNNQPNVTDKSGHKLDGVMTYFDGMDPAKKRFGDQIAEYWKAGWIDSMHTFGDFSRKNHADVSFNRNLAVAAWDEMKRVGLDCHVWINHGNEANVDAFGYYNPKLFSSYQAGDNPKSPFYHTDLTIKNGIRFVWDSNGESQFAWDEPTFAIQLRDGQKVWGFHRLTHEPGKDGKRDWIWVPREIQKQVTKDRLDALVTKGQYSILEQHLGGYNIGFPFDDKGVETLRMLAAYQEQGKVLVARTSRLLNYSVNSRNVEVAMTEKDGETWLNVTKVNDPIFGSQPLTLDNVRGLTLYVPHPEKTHLLLGMQPVDPKDFQVNPADETGKGSIEFRWFAPDVKDYSFYTGTNS